MYKKINEILKNILKFLDEFDKDTLTDNLPKVMKTKIINIPVIPEISSNPEPEGSDDDDGDDDGDDDDGNDDAYSDGEEKDVVTQIIEKLNRDKPSKFVINKIKSITTIDYNDEMLKKSVENVVTLLQTELSEDKTRKR